MAKGTRTTVVKDSTEGRKDGGAEAHHSSGDRSVRSAVDRFQRAMDLGIERRRGLKTVTSELTIFDLDLTR